MFNSILGSRDAGLGIGPAGLLSRDRVSGVLRVSKRVGVGVKICLRVKVRVRGDPRGWGFDAKIWGNLLG